MKIVFMGTPDFAASFLHALHSQHDVLAVVTQPDKPAGRGQQLTPPAVKLKAIELGLPVLQPEDLRDPKWLAELHALQPEALAVVAYSILPPEVLAIPRLGAVNVHTSLLPKYRGAAPVQHALLNGEAETGMSIFQLDNKMDHGPLLAQWTTPIAIEDSYTTVMQRFVEAGPKFLCTTLDDWEANRLKPLEQDHTKACGARKLKKEDGLLDFTHTVQEVHNRIRALNAWPVGYAFFKGKMLRIHSSRPANLELEGIKGQLQSTANKQLVVRCGDGWLELLKVQPEGRKAISGEEFWRGLQQRDDLCLEKA